jgi:YidC/Oxa1 family membrane protein insertase
VFGQFLMLLYKGTNSYVLALIIFTLVIKLVLFPLSIKGKKSMMQTQALQGKMKQLQAQYGKDKNRYNEEVQKLYEKENVNPMGGCLWSFLPLPILWGVYAVVRRPLFFLYGLTAGQLEAINGVISDMGIELGTKNAAYAEMKVAELFNSNTDFLDACKNVLGDSASKLDHLINFNFLGLNLAETPKLKFWTDGLSWSSIGLFLIPIVVALVSMGSSFVTQRTNSYTRDKNAPMDASTKQMLILMPLMYLWFGFIMPAAMCIYMMTNAIISMLQEMLAARMLRGKYQEMQAKREEEERLEKEAEKRRKAEKIAKRQQEEAEAKERRKKAAAIAAAGGSAVKKESAAVKKDSANNKGAVGIRKYARGRDYDPDRFGGVTPYKDPSEVDEAAIEAALAKKKSGKKGDQE